MLLSGGLDSTTCLALANEAGFATFAMTFDYGQRQRVELQAAAQVAKRYGCAEHRYVSIDLRAFGGSALTSDAAVPKGRSSEAMGEAVPITYVPARNTIFLSYALAWAEVLAAYDIFIGVNVVDYSGYPDCRPAFIEAFERLAQVATCATSPRGGPSMKIQAPLMHMSKAAIARQGARLGLDYSLTHSCYDPLQDLACGHCDACILRRQGFLDASLADPTRYHATVRPAPASK